MIGVQLSLLIGLPIVLLIVVGASWWLAGQAMQPVYRSYRQMQQFTADAAHELRTPLYRFDLKLHRNEFWGAGAVPLRGGAAPHPSFICASSH